MLHPHPDIAAKLKGEDEHCPGRPLPGGPLRVVLLASPGDTAKFRVALTAFFPRIDELWLQCYPQTLSCPPKSCYLELPNGVPLVKWYLSLPQVLSLPNGHHRPTQDLRCS